MAHQPRPDQPPLWDRPPAWEHDLDALVRPSLVVAPPPDVQQALLAAVLQAAAQPRAAALAIAAEPVPAVAAGRSVPFTGYVLLAAVCLAYIAALTWIEGLVGDGGWLATLTAQILAASDAVLGPLSANEPLTLTWLLLQRAPWLALLPIAWLLWERDRSSSSSAT